MRFRATARMRVIWLGCAAFLLTASMDVFSQPGLLVVAHGSHSREWNRLVLQTGKEVESLNRVSGEFRAVRTAFLEVAKPDVASALEELEKLGCDRIVVVPLFIAPSAHTYFDIPAVLGVYFSPTMEASLAGEGARIARPSVPVVLTNTLAEGDMLCSSTLDRVRALSKRPRDEALILLVHGADHHSELVCSLMRRISSFCCGRTGIDYADWVCVGIGQDYGEKAIPAIQRALRRKNRVLVVGVYVGLSADQIHKRYVESLGRGREAKHGDPLAGKDVVFSRKALLPDPRIAGEILRTARRALRN